jgi:hypothetical protein
LLSAAAAGVRGPGRAAAAGDDLLVGLAGELAHLFQDVLDRVRPDALMASVARRVHDKRALKLIPCYLEAGAMEAGLVHATIEGDAARLPTLAAAQQRHAGRPTGNWTGAGTTSSSTPTMGRGAPR